MSTLRWPLRSSLKTYLQPSQTTCQRAFAVAASEWQVVIGLEIHAQIRSSKKLFSNASTLYGETVNTQFDKLDAAFPGSLPVLNLEAVRLSLLTALALKCSINARSTFDRKHYFYHDIPASYQITQHYNPLARNGTLAIHKGDNGVERDLAVGIQQLQVEQDTAKSQLVADQRLVDLNRAGVGLMEIVTEPDMRSAEEAGAFVRKLQALLRRIGAGDGDMEKGNLRVDANVSVHKPGTALGTRCEIKNLNSVRYLQQAIEFERQRHIKHYTTSDMPLAQETRTMNEITGETSPLRTKEDAQDYRYMPDANLPALDISPAYLKALKAKLPEMPWETVNRICKTYDVPKRDVETLLSLDEYGAAGITYFEEITQGETKLGKRSLNWIVHEMLGQLYRNGQIWTARTVPSQLVREIVIAIEDRKITGTNSKAVLKFLLENPSSRSLHLDDILDEIGISSSCSIDLQELCQDSINSMPLVAKDVQAGQMKAIGRLIGDVMKRSGGAADAKSARNIILEILGTR